MKKDLEKAEVHNEFFASVFIGSQASYSSQVPEPPRGGWGNEVPFTVSKEQVQDHLIKLNSHKSVGWDVVSCILES